MILILQRLLRYYDVDIMDSLSYFTHETIDSVDSFIGRGNSSIDSDNSGSNGSNTSNSGNSSNSGDSSQEAEESLSKEYKETVRNASDDDDDREIPILFYPGKNGSNRGDSDNGGSNRSNSLEKGVGKRNKDDVYIRSSISYLFKSICKYCFKHIEETIKNIIPTIFPDYTGIFSTLTEYTQNIGTHINTALASLAVNITSFTDSISFFVKSHSSICQYIGCAIIGIGCAILISIKTGYLIQVQYCIDELRVEYANCIEKLRVEYSIVKLRVEYLIDKLRFEHAIGKLPDLIIQYTKILLDGPPPEIHLKNLEIMFCVPTFTINNLAGISNLHYNYIAPNALFRFWYSRVNQVLWNDLSPENVTWLVKENHLFRLTIFKRIKKILGLKCFGNLSLTYDTVKLSSFQTGLKSLCDHVILTQIVQIRTLLFSKSQRRYIWGMFNILVTLGVGVVVWYKFVPGTNLPYPVPEEILHPPAYETFKYPSAFVEGYKRVTYFIRNDSFMKIIIPANYEVPPMEYLLPPIEDIARNKRELGSHYASITTAITIATFIATNMLVHGTTAIMQQ